MSVAKFDVEAGLAGLKDFQRRTVDYAFRRMYEDSSPSHRFLIADEVGLGKTLVARGIIAKAVEHLQRVGVKRIDVLYICSNASIAQQNLRKLNVTDQDTSEFATRLTLLPTQLKSFKASGINFISFTPGTTFDLKSRSGRIDERAILYQMLAGRLGVMPKLLFRLLQGNAGTRSWTGWARRWKAEYDQELADGFAKALLADAPFMERLTQVCGKLQGVKRVSAELSRERAGIVGELRRRLADVCVDALEPDLVVLDEFQRFKDLLHGDVDNDAATLARRLFEYESEHGEVRVLLLSATPYRMLSMDHEAHEDHYTDFLETLRFLFSNDERQVQAVRDEFRRFRQALYGLEPDAVAHARGARDRLEGLLRSVIARTERVDMTAGRNAMLRERPTPAPLERGDLLAARFAERLAGCVDAGDIVEYWKSSPYLVNFMGEYELKRKLLAKCGKAGEADLHAAVASANGELLRNSAVQRYRAVNAANPRLRALLADTVDAGQWRWLWLPPALPYLRSAGAYADASSVASTKALVFSNWQIVPKAIAALCSYEAERRMLSGSGPPAAAGEPARASPPSPPLPKYRVLHKERRPLLRFSIDRTDGEHRPTGMPVLALLYPCATLAAVVDPLRLGIELGAANDPADPARALAAARERIANRLASLPEGLKETDADRPDERWYWAAPVLLDRHFAEEALAWLDDRDGFTAALADEDGTVGRAARRHLTLLTQAAHAKLTLGRRPDDLADVMAELALSGPGVCSVRAMQRVAHDLPETSFSMLTAAVRIATGLRTLFNQPDVVSMLHDPAVPYWRRVLQYGIDGNLQAVLDEYCHVLRDAEGLAERPGCETVGPLSEVVHSALSLRTATVDVDDLKATPAGHVRRKVFRMRSRLAMRFGDVKDDQGKTLLRSGGVRQAFNSPFRPFVLASTSVGQEGLDFHPYCHAVYHWNLPANPVDLEQREGRVHRYKGHAVRRNLAATYGIALLRDTKAWHDPWEAMFAQAAADRPPGASELVPYWLFEPGGHAVERRVPLIPLSRETFQLQRLKRMLAVYRLAFGQPRQEELLCYLENRGQVYEGGGAERLRLRLTP